MNGGNLMSGRTRRGAFYRYMCVFALGIDKLQKIW